MCIFCEFAKEATGESGYGPFFFRFDIHPVTMGHLLIIPKRHVRTSQELDAVEEANVFPAIKAGLAYVRNISFVRLYGEMEVAAATEHSAEYARHAAQMFINGMVRDGQNIGWNDGTAAGQTVDHFHIHIIPRYKGDMIFPEGGVRNVIPMLGNYKRPIFQ